MLRRWNFTLIVIVTVFVVGIGIGYTYRDRFVYNSNFLPWKLASTQQDMSGAILQSEVAKVLTPKSTAEAVSAPKEVYSFYGYVRSISNDSIVVDQPDDTTPDSDAIQFTLTADTLYADIAAIVDANGLPDSVETPLVQTDIKVGDIVTVYTLEDMRTADVRHVTKVQRIKDTTLVDNQITNS